MNLEEFLESGQIDLASVVGAVRSNIGLEETDVLLAVGSLVEGIGNSKSDLDLWLITAREPLASHCRDVAVVVGKCVVDVKVITSIQITELLNRLRIWIRESWTFSHAANYTIEDRIILHRLLRGRVIFGTGGGRCSSLDRPDVEDVARLKLHVGRQMSRTIQVDMVGYRESGDQRSLVYAAQEVLGHAVDALAAGHHLTNPLTKWRNRMLEHIPAGWDKILRIQPTAFSAAEFVWRLHRAPKCADRETCHRHAALILNFSRAAFLWAETQLVHCTHPETSTLSETSTDFDRPLGDRPTDFDQHIATPILDLDVDFVISAKRVYLGKLNDFGSTASISMAEFYLVLLFDGITPLDQIRDLSMSTYDATIPNRTLERLIQKLMNAGLLWKATDSTQD